MCSSVVAGGEQLTDPQFYGQMSVLLDDLIKQSRADAVTYEAFLRKAEAGLSAANSSAPNAASAWRRTRTSYPSKVTRRTRPRICANQAAKNPPTVPPPLVAGHHPG